MATTGDYNKNDTELALVGHALMYEVLDRTGLVDEEMIIWYLNKYDIAPTSQNIANSQEAFDDLAREFGRIIDARLRGLLEVVEATRS